MKEIIEKVKNDPRYLKNIEYGKPRRGHPEGKVLLHINHLMNNLGKISEFLDEMDDYKLEFLIRTHDTFKADAQKGSAIIDPNSHASLAVAFASEFTDDKDLLAMIQWHDEGFALYRQLVNKNTYNHNRLEDLFNKINDWNLFLIFNIVDTCTPGKDRGNVYWLLERAVDRFGDKIDPDILYFLKLLDKHLDNQ